MNNKVRNVFLGIGIISLFIISSVSSFATGLNHTLKDDECLENPTYLCTDESGFSEEKYEYYKQKYLNDYPKYDDGTQDVVEPIENKINYDLPMTIPTGSMDSPWPMKCHDAHHTGRSPFGTAENQYNEIWRYESNYRVDADPSIGEDGTIYIGGGKDNLPDYLFAIYPNGTLKWEYYAGGLIWNMCPAIADDGTIYFGAWDNSLHAVNSDGSEKWKFDAGSDIKSSPAIAEDGTIYFGTMLPRNEIIAVNSNGTEKWRYEIGDITVSDPAIGDDGTIYIGSQDNNLYALYPNGTLRWYYETGDSVCGPPSIADDGTIYVGSYDDYLYALYPNGTLRWKTEIWFGSDTNPSIGQDGTIHISSASKLFAVNPDNGYINWEFDLGGTVMHSSSAICADGIIYTGIEIGDRDGGEIVAVNPDGTERWRERLSNFWCDSSPCIGSDGTIYISSGSFDDEGEQFYLHAFGIGEPKKIEIEYPETGKLYLFGHEIISTPFNNTVIIGNIDVEVHAYSEEEIETIDFYIDGSLQFTDTDPPFEWTMNQRYGKRPLIQHTIKVKASYNGGCSWTEEIDVWYFHLLNN